ncbi:hypothetical protein O0I10_012688 [Lichtheimia ornata]|uniref:Fork-head domain-containing protein n=1 Tax=Lichtheimia ornata TaxID=688661 RepID=A0AAD7XT02_9FUNG|nr:uncharacterized protein O0I10_012688 [Lichtheimia ornata]KAJ8651741.1 hypothetical protein O0I10_012688 [Lichtheimia ornata]
MSTNNNLEAEKATQCHGLDDMVVSTTTTCTQSTTHSPIVEYPPPIPVALRHPHLVASVKQYRSDVQQQQLKQHIVSESFIPVAPDMVKPPRRRRRPPFSYSSLIAQAILASDHEKLTLREIYQWIMEKYPALYDVNDTGWQNTIRHNLSLNKCFKKVPKSELDGATHSRGKGGYWTVDPAHMAKYKDGSFPRGSTTAISRRKEPREIRMKMTSDNAPPSPSSPPPPPTSSVNPTNTTTQPSSSQQQQRSSLSSSSIPSSSSSSSPSRIMQIQNLLN